MAKPHTLAPIFDNIPEELQAIPHWIVWKHWLHRKRKVWIKLPIDPTTEDAASVANPASWGTFEMARAAYELFGGYDGVGFVFTADIGLVGIDIDKCLTENDDTSELAKDILQQELGYVEYSPSGSGLHIITRGELPRAYKNDKIGLELYNTGRFFTITGVLL